MRAPLCSIALALATLPAVAAPPDQPPLGFPVITPNFDYYVRSGQQAPHLVPDLILSRTARALDRNGTSAPGNPLGMHAGLLARGFAPPYFSGTFFDVVYWRCANNPGGFDCDNGFATLDQIIMPTDVYGAAGESCIRGIVGHELFHHVEFGYANAGGGAGCGKVFGSTPCEGQARAMQDKIYFDLDLDPAASCVAPFKGEVDGYLGNPDRTIWKTSYASALFWTYLMEQYGEYAFEPGTGVDFLVDWWDFAQASVNDPNIYNITDAAIKVDHPNDNATNAYHDFLIANYVKDTDLSSVSETFRRRYSYRDEEPVPLRDNKMSFKSVKVEPAPLFVPFDGPVSTAVTAKRFGGRYHVFDTGDCTAGRVLEFSATPSPLLTPGPNAQFVIPDGLFALVALRGDSLPLKPVALYKFRGKGASQTIVQPATRHRYIAAITSGWHSDFAGTLTMRCKAPPLAPVLSLASTARPAVTGTPGNGSIGELQVQLNESQAPFAPIDDISAGQVEVAVGLLLPAVQKVREAAARMRVFFPYPSLPLGTQADITVKIGAGQVILSSGSTSAAHAPEILIGIDLSASMAAGGGARLAGLKRALRTLLVDLPSNARVGLISFAGATVGGSNATLQVPLAPLNTVQRAALIAAADGATATTAGKVSMNDFHFVARSEFATRGSTGERHVVVFTDSGDAAADADAIIQVARDGGIRIHNIALATSADQPALARIANETGGRFDFAADDADPAALLLPAVQKVREAAARSQSAYRGTTTVNNGILTLTMDIDPETASANGNTVVGNYIGTNAATLRLFRPDGSRVLPGTGVELHTTGDSFAFHVAPGAVGPSSGGAWRLEADAGGAGPATLSASFGVVDPARSLRLAFAPRADGAVPGAHLIRDEPVLIQLAVLDFTGAPAPKGGATALVKSGAGTLSIGLNDDGVDGDEQAEDGVYSKFLRRAPDAAESGYEDDGTFRGSNGSYVVEAEIDFGTAAAPNVLRTRGSFAVLDDAPRVDTDGDGLPNRYEVLQRCVSATVADGHADGDGDGASNAQEFDAGTDPCEVDTDGGGEADGSELARGAEPLAPGDDGLRRIEHVELVDSRSEHEDETDVAPLALTLRYDSDPDYSGLLVKRAPSPTGPFVDHATLDAAATDGSYADTNLVAGANWCYQLVPRVGNSYAGASDLVCGTVKTDATAPRGSVVLNDGAPRTASTLLSAVFAIDGEASTGMQMRVRRPDGSDTGWIPYATSMAIDAAPLLAPEVATVVVAYRDAAGNVSPDHVDDIALVASAGLGRIIGTVRSAEGAHLPIAGAFAMPALETEPSANSGIDGRFALELLPPAADHAVTFEAPGYNARVLENVAVTPGTTTDLGDILLEPAPLFADGFE